MLHLAVRQTALWAGLAAGVSGLVLGLVLVAVLRHFRKPGAGSAP